ncbi:MAG: urea ABC transporter permease subunit UrtB, partial [Proteobacteria bacterium]|nr:urea ABC transporter permease subunit UrtB [Pseudomonadota bacterium]
ALIEIQSSLSPEASGSKVEMTSNAINAIETELQIGQFLSVLYSGLSYSSILFLAAIGLAIVFGLMGVINLAQGEFIMIGAYITFVIQELLASFAYGLVPFYLLISIPFVFVLTGGIGAAIEYSVIRHLYTRPLMTLLATWGVSIFLVNAVRVLFGTQNLEFYVPDYLVGGVTLFGDFLVTWNRLATIGFAVLVLLLTWILVNKTRFGVNVRAVTENRNMAGAIGIDTRKVDVLSFALGSGLAGLAGLALSTIYNVNPTMGTNFIVDAFMVVVLGGVGSIWGTLLAALLVGIVNVAIEPVYGAVAAKVIVMTLIIVVIQFRPEGLFSLKVRK